MQLPEFRFEIGQKIKDQDGQTYVVNDITYSMLDKCWFYRYSYYEDGYEHYCYAKVDFIEGRFESL